MWPVILRELRAGSRRWTTYWLRLLAAGSVMVAILLWLGGHVYIPQAGLQVFTWMHYIVVAAIWVVVPLMTCDCISSEKREGTLGLLFLTNLRAREIVFAKAAAHGLRALTLWLATVPLIAVPVLLGGLSWREIVLSCCFSLASICFALCVGVIASARTRRLNGSVALAVCLSALAHLFFVGLVIAVMGTAALVTGMEDWQEVGLWEAVGAGLALVWNTDSAWRDISATSKAGLLLILSAAAMTVLSFLILLGTTIIVADRLRHNWQDKPKTKRQTEVEKFFCAPSFFPKLFRGWMRRSLDRNPIGWLEKRSWSGRIMSWIALSVMISFASMLTYTAASREDSKGFNVLMWMLLVSIAFVAAGSFRRERETGAMELILVTPLSERQIIFGRLRGLWNQFLPTFLLWVSVVLYLSSALKDWQVVNLIRFTVMFLVVPVIGLYFSLRSRFLLLSWVATLGVSFALPQMIWRVFYYLVSIFYNVSSWDSANPSLDFSQFLFVLILQLTLAALFLWRLRVNLVRRTFSFR